TMQREKTPEWREKQKSSRGIRRGQRYRLVFQFPIREHPGSEINLIACRENSNALLIKI
ncbi:IS91 family transposase, partial [Escherichia coli]|nr:IS91 family transposase [Escherichia coli]